MNLTKDLESKVPLLREEYERLVFSLDKAIQYAINHKEVVLSRYVIVTKEEMAQYES